MDITDPITYGKNFSNWKKFYSKNDLARKQRLNLSDEEKIELHSISKQEGIIAKRALNKLIQEYTPMVFEAAKYYAALGDEGDDMVQIGYLGLMNALKSEIPQHMNVNGYVWCHILYSLGNYHKEIHNLISLPARMNSVCKEINNIEKELISSEIIPTDEMIARKTNLSGRYVDIIRSEKYLHKRMDLNILQNEPLECTHYDGKQETIQEVLNVLTQKERKVIDAYFGLNGDESISLDMIAEKMNRSRECIRQIKEKSLKRIKRRNSLLDKLKSVL